jgi:hypothetical protein
MEQQLQFSRVAPQGTPAIIANEKYSFHLVQPVQMIEVERVFAQFVFFAMVVCFAGRYSFNNMSPSLKIKKG